MLARIWGYTQNELRLALSEKGPIPFLDGLRGVAAVMVVVGHTFPQALLPWPPVATFIGNMGGYGVTLFFILSGFLISSYFWGMRIKGSENYRLKDFFWRRALRVLPLFYITSALFFVLYYVLTRDGSHTGSFPYYLLTIQNFAESWNEINPPTWSVGVEIHFYIVVALLFWAVRHQPGRVAVLAVAGLFLACTVYKAWAFPQVFHLLASNRDLIYANSLARMDAFVLGIVLAGLYAYRQPQTRARLAPHWPYLRVLGGVVLVLAAVAVGTGIWLGQVPVLDMLWGGWGEALTAALFASIVWAGLVGARWINGLFVNKLTRFWGKVSFSLYLLHLPLYTWLYLPLFTKLGLSPWLAFGSFLVVMHGVSFASYIVLERPFLTIKKRFR